MKRIVEISPIGQFANIQINCLFEYEGEIYLLSEKDKVERFPRGTKDLPPEYTVSFDTKNSKLIRYEYEDGDDATLLDLQIKEVVLSFWGLNPVTLINGKRHGNSKAQLLNVDDIILRNVASYEEWKLQVEVSQTLDTFSPERLLNVAYYYGLRPTQGTKRGELIMLLANFKDGVLHRQVENGRSLFLEVWSRNSDADRDMVVYIKKAIQYGIIANKFNAGHNNYFLEQTRLGMNIDDIVTFFRTDDKLYKDHIVREVDKVEKRDVVRFKEETQAIDVNTQQAMDGNIDGVELERLRREVERFKEQNLVEMDFNTTKASVRELNEQIETAMNKKRLISQQPVKQTTKKVAATK